MAMAQDYDSTSHKRLGDHLESSRSHGSLTERAHQVLRGAILCGQIEEGTFLTEARARDKFRIGHTPFREACSRLVHEGFLELIPRRGYFVPQMTLSKVRDFFEARIILESQAVELAAIRASKDQIRTMAELLRQRVPSRLNAATVEVIVRANAEFHRYVAEMTQNEEIVQMVERLVDRSARLVYLFKGNRARFNVHRNHREIFDAIRERDGQKARRLIIADIQAGQSELFL
jgi:DNA-binding GntR family transcriptional regulator